MRIFCMIICLFISINQGYASFNVASKGRTTGPTIHTTYFLTPNNAGFDVKAKAYFGRYINGNCVYNTINDMGTEFLQTGDFIDFDGFKLKFIAGIHYNCMSVYYTYRQLVIDTFILISDGINYIDSIPPTSRVNII